MKDKPRKVTEKDLYELLDHVGECRMEVTREYLLVLYKDTVYSFPLYCVLKGLLMEAQL